MSDEVVMRSKSLLVALAALATIVIGPLLPPVSFTLNWTGAWLVEQRAVTTASLIFRYLHAYGDATAANNLGVLCATRSIACIMSGYSNPLVDAGYQR